MRGARVIVKKSANPLTCKDALCYTDGRKTTGENRSVMAENDPKWQAAEGSAAEGNEDEKPSITIPPRAPLPPPPDVQFTRPTLGRTPLTKSSTSGGATDGAQDISSHGAGIAAGMTFLVSIIAGATLGSWIDGRWNHTGTPWGTLLMTVLGAAAGFINMQRLLTRADRTRRNDANKK